MKRDPEFVQEALRQASIVYAALIGTGVLLSSRSSQLRRSMRRA